MHGIIQALRGGHPARADALWMLLITLIWYSAITFLSYRLRGKHTGLFVWVEGIVTHVVAFGVIELVAEEQEEWANEVLTEHGPFHLQAFYFSWIPITMSLLFVLHKLMSYVRGSKYFASEHAGEAEAEKPSPPSTSATGDADAAVTAAVTDTAAADDGKKFYVRNNSKSGQPDTAVKPGQPDTAGSADAIVDTEKDESDDSCSSIGEESGEENHEHHEEPWYEIAAECEIEASAIVFGALFSSFVWSAIRPGKLVRYDCDMALEGEDGSSQGCRVRSFPAHMLLFFISHFVMFCVVLLSKMRNKMNDHKRLSDSIHAIQMHITFAYAFLTMTQIRWMTASIQFYLRHWDKNESDADNKILHSPIWIKCMNFMFYWMMFVPAVVLIDKLCDWDTISEKCGHRMIRGMSLAVAVFLETLYGQAVETSVNTSVSHFYGDHNVDTTVFIIVQFFAVGVLTVLIIPAWSNYIAPLAMVKIPSRRSHAQHVN
jgi:hypothetical protein